MRKQKYFYIPYLVFLSASIVYLLVSEKWAIHLTLNSFHSQTLDLIMKYVTVIGGWIPFAVAGVMFLWKVGPAIGILASQLVVTIIVTPLKHIFRMPRPVLYFSDKFPDTLLPIPEGVTAHLSNSFPSGHTASVFALLFSLSLLTKNRALQVFYCALAIVVGYSRVYLSQHFLMDVVVGSAIGVFSAWIIWYFMPKEKEWMDKSVFSLIRNRKDGSRR